MRELSIFIDESGDFGAYDPRSPFYIIGAVLHNQGKDIANYVQWFDDSLRQIGYAPNYIHVGPLIRREAEYKNLTIPERLRILRRLDKFSRPYWKTSSLRKHFQKITNYRRLLIWFAHIN